MTNFAVLGYLMYFHLESQKDILICPEKEINVFFLFSNSEQNTEFPEFISGGHQ